MWFFYSALNAMLRRKRVCAKCGFRQVVKDPEKVDKAVKCQRCGSKLPPPSLPT